MRISEKISPFIRIVLIPSKGMRKLYDWTLHWGKTRHAKYALFGISFAESSFFPIPPDVLLIAMTVARRFHWWQFATIATAGSVIGALFGYWIGIALFEILGQPIIDFYHLQKAFDIVGEKYSQNAFLAIFTAAFTPIPFKVFTIAAGVFQISLPELIVGSILGRAGRFFAVAGALRVFGKRISDTIEKYFDIFSLAFMALLVGGFVIIRFLG
ncbi:DedA family protein [Patescibacteria group bacterium]|nr:DedA family protein [Patescibacteria group bacterium]